MEPIPPGTVAPPIDGTDVSEGPRAVVFYKVTCPTCQIAAPVAERLHEGFPGLLVGVAQDPREKIEQFEQEMRTSFPSVSDQPPYEVSNAWGIRAVPTLFVLSDAKVADVVESWDRDGWNRAAARLGALTGTSSESLSWDGDGLPPFRPG
jgi:thiol-disulfide isomerase/thioredoxin